MTKCVITLEEHGEIQSWKVDRLPYFEHEDGDRFAHSESFICPRCTKKWATLIFDDEIFCWPRAAFCVECEPPDDPHYKRWHPVPGALLQSVGWAIIDLSLLEALPELLLRREFILTIRREGLENGC